MSYVLHRVQQFPPAAIAEGHDEVKPGIFRGDLKGFVELPAGLLDQEGEEPEEVARRELREEVALEARSWTHLTTAWSSPGISEERMHFFLARGLAAVDRGGFELLGEDGRRAGVPAGTLMSRIARGRDDLRSLLDDASRRKVIRVVDR